MSALFEPFRLGALELPNRIVMAPLGRARAHADTREPLPRVSRYYVQRATAGLIVSEATHVSVESVSRPGTAAIHGDGQVDAWRRVRAFADAAKNSRRAGFDGVEIHAANGFLIDQFLRDGANRRIDKHGGSIAARARFLLDVVDAVSEVFGRERVGVRLSPHHKVDGTHDSTPRETFGYAASQLDSRGVAYLHLIEPVTTTESERLAPQLRRVFRGPLILCGGFDRQSAQRAIDQGQADLIAFGVGFISNPDLVERLRRNAAWNIPDPSTYYSGGDDGYIDYPFLDAARSG